MHIYVQYTPLRTANSIINKRIDLYKSVHICSAHASVYPGWQETRLLHLVVVFIVLVHAIHLGLQSSRRREAELHHEREPARCKHVIVSGHRYNVFLHLLMLISITYINYKNFAEPTIASGNSYSFSILNSHC